MLDILHELTPIAERHHLKCELTNQYESKWNFLTFRHDKFGSFDIFFDNNARNLPDEIIENAYEEIIYVENELEHHPDRSKEKLIALIRKVIDTYEMS